MARDIKFRGKASGHLYNGDELLHKKGDWLYGDLIHQDDRCFICEPDKRFPLGTNFMNFAVGPETVGQFTGHKTIKERDVYEHDILFSEIALDNGDERMYCVVVYVNEVGGFLLLNVDEYAEYLNDGYEVATEHFASHFDFEFDTSKYHYAGNLFDNPELLTKTTER